MSKKLLIACYFFPPCPSIGGRRSAKFAKYLAKAGDEVYVIQAINPFQAVSHWLKDVEHEKNVHRYELPLLYPVEFIIPPKTIVGKIKYRLYNLYFNLFHSNKNRFDYTFFWEKAYLNKAEELIREHGINNILVSGPPFYYAYHSIKLKEKFPNLNVIIDFRDPWIGSPYYGMSSLKLKQQKYEIALMNDVYRKSDYFIGPNSFLLNKQKSYVSPTSVVGAQMVEISHAFDEDELKAYLKDKPTEETDNKIKLVYGGQLYPGTDRILVEFAKTLDELRNSNPSLYKNVQLDFYTPETHKINFFKNHSEIVHFYTPIGNNIMQKIAVADFCMIILADHNKDYKTTKFLEYSALRKPFIVLGNKGHVAQFVEENNLGRAYDETSINELKDLLSYKREFISNNFNRSFDLSNSSFEKVTEKLRAILK